MVGGATNFHRHCTEYDANCLKRRCLRTERTSSAAAAVLASFLGLRRLRGGGIVSRRRIGIGLALTAKIGVAWALPLYLFRAKSVCARRESNITGSNARTRSHDGLSSSTYREYMRDNTRKAKSELLRPNAFGNRPRLDDSLRNGYTSPSSTLSLRASFFAYIKVLIHSRTKMSTHS